MASLDNWAYILQALNAKAIPRTWNAAHLKFYFSWSTRSPGVILFFLLKSFVPKDKNKGFGLRGFNEAHLRNGRNLYSNDWTKKNSFSLQSLLFSLCIYWWHEPPKARQTQGQSLVSLAKPRTNMSLVESPKARQTQGPPLIGLFTLKVCLSQLTLLEKSQSGSKLT